LKITLKNKNYTHLNNQNNILCNKSLNNKYWGLGIGDWAQSPIPNPQSPTI